MADTAPFNVVMPQLGETVTEGTITKWFKKVGDQVAEDEPLFEVSTDKVDSEVPSAAAGYLKEILVEEGETVDVGAKLAVIGDGPPSGNGASGNGADAAPEASDDNTSTEDAAEPEPGPEDDEAEVQAVVPEPAPEAEAEDTPAPQAAKTASRKVLSPLVRRLLAENDLDADSIEGTGIDGRVTRNDVMTHLDKGGTRSGAAKPAATRPAAPAAAVTPQPRAGADEVIPFTNMRKRTAEHMVRSQATSAHVLIAMEVDFDAVDRVRLAEKDRFKAEEGFSLTYLPFVSRAVVDAVRDFPHVNASVGDNELIVHRAVNLGIAVDINFEGLIVPVIQDADGKRMRSIAREISDLAVRARSKKLNADEIAGGTFTITNPGGHGTFFTAAVINQPQVAILSTDGVRKRPVVVELPDGTDAIAIHPVGTLALSFDHRAFDGAYASAFLARCRDILETRDWSQELSPPGYSGGTAAPLRARWLGRVRFRDAHALQRALFRGTTDSYLLLLEHHPVYTVGLRGALDHLRVSADDLRADLVATDRGGDVTWHGPGQLVGYPVVSTTDSPKDHVHAVEQLVIDVCAALGLPGLGRVDGAPGVWVDPHGPAPRKICAIGVRRSRGRTMHGFALNVDPDLSWFDRIVPCGIAGKGVTSLAAEGVTVDMRRVVDAVVEAAAGRWGDGTVERADVAWERETPTGMGVATRKPEWLRVKVDLGPSYRDVRRTMRSLKLVTVCEEAGCPNIYECWRDGTATFMINGEQCTRACGFCQVDTSKPMAVDPAEAGRLAEAVADMGLAHAVITAVARDDLPDGGAEGFAESIRAVRRRCPDTAVEVLIPDCKGDSDALGTIFDARPDVLNHNLETVARLQRHVRPSASYARSLSVLGRAAATGLVTKSGLILGLGETEDEVLAAMADLQRVGVSILTLGQYLRPSSDHLPVDRWWAPEEFDRLAEAGRALGFAHVEASPLTRSSYHARQAAAGVVAVSIS